MRWFVIALAIVIGATVFYAVPTSHAPTLASWRHVTAQFKTCDEPERGFELWPLTTSCDGLAVIADSTSHARDDLCRIEIRGATLGPRALMSVVDDERRASDLRFAISELHRPYQFDGLVDGISVRLEARLFVLDACRDRSQTR